MINSELYDFIHQKAQAKNCKIIYTGDDKQLYPVKENGLSKPFQCNNRCYLTKVYRQQEDNPLLEGLGVKLADIPVEKKRNSRGYESNFVYLDTPIGRVECQLQTEDQYRFANYGFAAHTKMKGKKLNPVEIPDDNWKGMLNWSAKDGFVLKNYICHEKIQGDVAR